MSALRLFTCRACGHRMRYGADRCGNCQRSTGMLNRVEPLIVAALAVVFLVILSWS